MLRKALLSSAFVFGFFTATSALAAMPRVDLSIDYIRGNANAKITIVEYTDFECPFCIRHFTTMQKLSKKYGSKVNWVYRPLPLSFHEGADAKAVAADCVGNLKGKTAFWRFHDLLLKRSTMDKPFPVAKLPALAKNVSIDTAKFKACTAKALKAGIPDEWRKQAADAGANGTPANFIVDHVTGNSESVPGAFPPEHFIEVIDAMLSGTWKPNPAPEYELEPDTLHPLPTPAPSKKDLIPAVDRAWDHLWGNPNARWTLVLYGGTGDTNMQKAFLTVEKVINDGNGKVNMALRHYPLDIQPESQKAAEAMECAAELGGHEGFRNFTDTVFSTTPPRTDYSVIATRLGLGESNFLTCLFRGTRKAHIRQDKEGALSAGIVGTPAMFLIDTLSGKQTELSSALPTDALRQSIDAALKAAGDTQ